MKNRGVMLLSCVFINFRSKLSDPFCPRLALYEFKCEVALAPAASSEHLPPAQNERFFFRKARRCSF